MSYLDSGFNQNLIRTKENPLQIDNNNIGDFIRDGSISINSLGLRDDNIKDFMIEELSVEKLLAGDITVAMNVGGSNVKIDGANTRIIINDGSNDRILLGYLAGAF